jgi:hypothetical protein
LDKIEIS